MQYKQHQLIKLKKGNLENLTDNIFPFFGGGVWRHSWSLPGLLFHRSVGPARLPQDRFSQDQFQVEKSFTRTTTLESFAFKYEKLFLIFIARKLGTADFSSSPSILSTNWCTLLKSASLSSKSRYQFLHAQQSPTNLLIHLRLSEQFSDLPFSIFFIKSAPFSFSHLTFIEEMLI